MQLKCFQTQTEEKKITSLKSSNAEVDPVLTKVRVKNMSPGSSKCSASRVTSLEPISLLFYYILKNVDFVWDKHKFLAVSTFSEIMKIIHKK